jgi:hypothetical protein
MIYGCNCDLWAVYAIHCACDMLQAAGLLVLRHAHWVETGAGILQSLFSFTIQHI